MSDQQVNKIFDKRYRLGVLPNAEGLMLPRIPRPPEKTPLLQTGTLDEIDGGAPPSDLKVDISKTRVASVGTRDTTDNFFMRNPYASAYTTVSPKSNPGSQAFEKVVNAVKDNSSNIVNLVIVIVILVTENLVKGNLFTCPCEYPDNVWYGAAFLAAPAVALFVLGIMINNITWMLTTGCLTREKTVERSILSNCHHVIGICLRATVAPVAWLIIGFIDGQFYECASDKTPCEISPEEKSQIRAESQLIGYITMMVSMVLAIIGTLLHKATRKLTYEQDRYVRIYRDVERQEMQEAFTTHARDRARQNIQEFLANEESLKSQKAWEAISRPDKSNQEWNTPNGAHASISCLDEHVNGHKVKKNQTEESAGKPKRDGSKNSVKM